MLNRFNLGKIKPKESLVLTILKMLRQRSQIEDSISRMEDKEVSMLQISISFIKREGNQHKQIE